MGQSPCNLALNVSRNFLCTEPLERVISVIVIEKGKRVDEREMMKRERIVKRDGEKKREL